MTAGAGPRHFRFHPNGRWFVLFNELDASLRVFDYDAVQRSVGRARIRDSVLKPGFKGKAVGCRRAFRRRGPVRVRVRTHARARSRHSSSTETGASAGRSITRRQSDSRAGSAVDPSGTLFACCRAEIESNDELRHRSGQAAHCRSSANIQSASIPFGSRCSRCKHPERDTPGHNANLVSLLRCDRAPRRSPLYFLSRRGPAV